MTAVAIQQLQFSWPGTRQDGPAKPTINIANFALAKGEKCFLKGASGSGKSTLLQLIAGVLVPSAGEITVLSQPLSRLSAGKRDQFRADHLGFVFQLFNLLGFLSVIDNVLLPCRFSNLRAQRAMTQGTNLAHAATNLLTALGLDEHIHNQTASRLSVGQQQRVALARALLGAPGLIICDEPTSAIDVEHRERFMQLLLAQVDKTGAALLFVSHDPTLERYFDRTVHLADINHVQLLAEDALPC
jgi:putative ABC transport system ATP-binding protein